MLETRNLIPQGPDKVKKTEAIHVGRPAVLECISKLPKTVHDRSLFTVDLLQFSVSE